MTEKKIKTVLDFQGLIKAFVKLDTAALCHRMSESVK